ncbi:multicopper oxidase family protein [Sulfurospirillum sp. 1307]|jgi:FtsP/CotA-like multicopper oxidase with cupredoxin domain
MKRRNFIKFSSVLVASSLYNTKADAKTISFKEQFSEALAIPPVASFKMQGDTKVYELNIKKGQMAFLDGAMTDTYGVNGNFLGPTIRVNKNDKLILHVKNSLDEITTLHWHGLKVKGSSDGGPHSIIPAGEKWSADIKIDQRACTAWYHPHAMHKTGEQVFKGIAGLFIIEDEDSKRLDLPKEYGIDDIPLVLQDRRFDNSGQFLYKQSMHDTMMGVTGNVHLINGINDPYLEVEPKLIRFRILNGANARIYNIMFEKGKEFVQIASDSSFLPKPVKLKNFIIAPGERGEILADFSKLAGQTIYFGDGISQKALLKIIVKKSNPIVPKIPKRLINVDDYKNIKISNRRVFTLNMSMMFLGINGKQMDMSRIDEEVKKDTYEIWEIRNPSPRPHPFHVHGTAFKVLSRNGNQPFKNEFGLKDTVLVYGREKVEILVTFKHKATKNRPYMYHCHILEHEDAGMMGQFTVS